MPALNYVSSSAELAWLGFKPEFMLLDCILLNRLINLSVIVFG